MAGWLDGWMAGRLGCWVDGWAICSSARACVWFKGWLMSKVGCSLLTPATLPRLFAVGVLARAADASAATATATVAATATATALCRGRPVREGCLRPYRVALRGRHGPVGGGQGRGETERAMVVMMDRVAITVVGNEVF